MENTNAYYTFLKEQYEMSRNTNDGYGTLEDYIHVCTFKTPPPDASLWNAKVCNYQDVSFTEGPHLPELVPITTGETQGHRITTGETQGHHKIDVKTISQNYNRQYNRIMVFDVETTGLLPKKDPITKLAPKLEDMPHIIQLSFIIYNIRDGCIEMNYNAYIDISKDIPISEKITEITGITRETCDEKGVPMEMVLCDFYKEFSRVDCVVAHNIDFDRAMIEVEVQRNYEKISHMAPGLDRLFDPEVLRNSRTDTYCTMKKSIHICNIMAKFKKNPANQYKKFPRLDELYFTLFGSIPENLHNSIIDTLVCLRCFLKIKMNQDIHIVKYNHMLKSVRELL